MSKIVLVSKATGARYEFTSRSEAVNTFASGGYRWSEEDDAAAHQPAQSTRQPVTARPVRSPQEAQRSESPRPVPPEAAGGSAPAE